MSKLIITIDGPAGSGKSTAARLLAQKLDAVFLDTGAMYRAVTLLAMQSGIDLKNEDLLEELIKANTFKFKADKDKMFASINGRDVTDEIRDLSVTENAKYISSSQKVRKRLVGMQREFAAGYEKIVTEGRDQGTVAFPDADVKFFLTADSNERAKRRQAELKASGVVEPLEAIKKAIEKRDESDRSRKVGPLKPAKDAIEIDSTNLSIEQMVDKMFNIVNAKCLKRT